MAFDRGSPRLSSFFDLTIIINRSTELPLGLRNQPSGTASPSASSSPSSQGVLNIPLVLGAIGGSVALLAVITAFGVGLFLVWQRHRRKRRYIDRKDRVVKALTFSEELKLSGEDTPFSERTRDDLCGQALLKGTLDDDVKVRVQPDILSRSPRRLRPEGRYCDDSLGRRRKSRDDDDEESNDVEKEDGPVTSIDCDIMTHRKNTNQVMFLVLNRSGLSYCLAFHCIAIRCLAFYYLALRCLAFNGIEVHCLALHCLVFHCF